ncbi:MAG: serine/threonine-protein kinase [Polyangiales bacterium]
MPILTEEERIGTTLSGKYVLDAVIGRGGMGTVFAGHHALSSRAVAVKVLHPQHVRDPVAVRRFLNEARTAAAFRHANVVDVLDVDVLDDGTVFLVLELLEGETLGELLSRVGKLSLDETLSILVPVLKALSHAHRLNIVHRDLKPDNIFLTPGKKSSFPVLLDFGIAKMLDAPEQSIETVTGTIIGTPQYMAPEQALGSSENTAQLDIYAMGVVLFECLAGERPIDGTNPAAVLAKLVTGQVPTLISVAPDVAPSISAIVSKALATNASDRWESCDAFADALLKEAERLGVHVELPQPGDRMTAGEGARTQRLRAITDSSARKLVKGKAHEPANPTLSEQELEDARSSLNGGAEGRNSTPYGGIQRPRSHHSTISPTTAQRTARTTPASMLGAALAFVVVGGAGIATLRREPEIERQTTRAVSPTAAANAAHAAPREPAVQQTTQQAPSAPQAVAPTVATSAAHADAGAATSVRRVVRSGTTGASVANTTSTAGAATTASAATSTSHANAVGSTNAAQPTGTSNNATRTQTGSGSQRAPEVNNVW